MMSNYIKLIRAKHYIKNILVLIPMVCAREMNLENCFLMLFGFLSFCCLSSAIYILNDIHDVEVDRLHPRKKDRPLASGSIKISSAGILMAGLLVLAIVFNTIANQFTLFNHALAFIIAYAIINIAYSMGIKNITILDIVFLASGFVFRVYYGAAILSIVVSEWLFLTILSASMFMGLGKRKKELEATPDARKVLKDYRADFLDKFQYVMLTLIIVFYALWTVQQGNALLMYSVVFVLIILMRYCLVTNRGTEGDPTSVLYSDKVLLALCFIYAVYMLAVFTV